MLSLSEREEVARGLAESHDEFLVNQRRVHFYDYQKQIRDMLFHLAIVRDANDMFVEISRQSGKTTGVIEPLSYLMGTLSLILGREIAIGFFAPRYEQAKTDWSRVKDIMPSVADIFGLKQQELNSNTMSYVRRVYAMKSERFLRCERASTMYAFSLGETTKLESKTLDIAVIEEAHECNDQKFKKEVLPMLSATNGFAIFIGVAGYRLCDFKTGVEQCPRSFVFPVHKVIESRRRTAEEAGDPVHLEYEKFYKSVLEKTGNIITDEIKTQYLLEWVTERGNFVTRTQLEKCRKRILCVGSPEVYVGIDWGKYTDATVVTVSTALGQRLKSIEFQGTQYLTQVPLILEWLQKEIVGRGYEIEAIQCDSTGSGDVILETFDKESRWKVKGFVFSAPSKANLYQTFANLISVGEGITDGVVEDTGQKRFEYWGGCPMVRKFEFEMLELVKEYKGDKMLLSCHHPERNDAHDDTVDSCALSVSYQRKSLSMTIA